MVLIFQFVNVVYYIDWFADIIESLHSWDKAHLVMMYNLFNMFWILFARILLQIFASILPAAAAKSLQLCPTLCDPTDSSPLGSPVLGFSRQEHWSGLPFPSPVHESEKWKWSRSVVSDSSRPHGLQPTRLFRPWDFPGKSTGVGHHCLLRSMLPSSS